MRRLRQTSTLRRLVAETKLSVDDLVAPLFVREGIDAPQPIESLPGVVQHTQDSLAGEVERLAGLYHSGFELVGLGGTGSLVLLATSAGLGLLGSWVAVGHHLAQVESGKEHR